MNKIKRVFPLKTKILLYNSLILPHLNYGILAWVYHCERVSKLRKKSIRILSLSKYNAHSEPIFQELKLLKVKDILWLQELKFYYKYKNHKLPHNLQNLPLQSNMETHNYATGTLHNIHHPKTQHEYAKKSAQSQSTCTFTINSVMGYNFEIKMIL